MRIKLYSFLVWGLGMIAGQTFAEGQVTTLQAMMIRAQHEAAPMDRRLERVEYKLRRVFQFPFYLYVGEGSLALGNQGEGNIALPDQHKLHVRMGGKGRVEVRWFRGDEALLSTSVSVSRDAPVVLGGVPSGDGTLILVLSGK